MNDVTQFLFQPERSLVKHKVRTITQGNDPWFVLADVCAVLDIANPWTAAARLDADEKGLHTMEIPGGAQQINLVNESGLWSLVLTSRKPEAKAFKKWMTSVVIPSIRKNGGYIAGQETMTAEQTTAKALLIAQSIIEKNEGRIAELSPRAVGFDTIVAPREEDLLHTVVKAFGNGEVNSNRIKADLAAWGI